MPYFPQLNANGLMVQHPYTATQRFLNSKNNLENGKQFAYAWIGGGLNGFPSLPLSRFELQYPHLTDDERAVLEAFFVARRGRLEDFTFLDPCGNLLSHSEDFSNAAWEKIAASVGAATVDPFGGNLARTLAGSSSNSMITAYCLPDGGASGFVLTGSVWVKSATNSSLNIGFIDSGFGVLGSTSWPIRAGEWTRIWHTITLATASNIRLLIGGFSSWGAVSLALFGAQVVPLPGPGGYAKSPGNYGIHSKCRFDEDALTLRHIGPNQTSASIPIIETN